MKVHIGKEIARIQKLKGINNTDFSKLIHTSVRNLTNIKANDDISVSQLYKISEALSFNFFSMFEPIVVEAPKFTEPSIPYKRGKKHTVKIEVRYPTELSPDLGKFMLHVDAVAEKMGFEIV